MMYIFKVPAGTDIYSMSEDVQEAVLSVSGQFPEAKMIGTEAVNGYQLVLVWAAATKAQLEALIESFLLDWSILAAENEIVQQAALLPFFSDKPVFDNEGVQTGIEPVADLTDIIQLFSGHEWTY